MGYDHWIIQKGVEWNIDRNEIGVLSYHWEIRMGVEWMGYYHWGI